MNADVALFWAEEAIVTAAFIAMPLLLVGLLVGLTVSLFQAVTSIQEMTLSYIPKILLVGFVLYTMAPVMLQKITDFIANCIRFIPEISN